MIPQSTLEDWAVALGEAAQHGDIGALAALNQPGRGIDVIVSSWGPHLRPD